MDRNITGKCGKNVKYTTSPINNANILHQFFSKSAIIVFDGYSLIMIVGVGILEKRGEEDSNEMRFVTEIYPLFQP
jgi:hypothetical protein